MCPPDICRQQTDWTRSRWRTASRTVNPSQQVHGLSLRLRIVKINCQCLPLCSSNQQRKDQLFLRCRLHSRTPRCTALAEAILLDILVPPHKLHLSHNAHRCIVASTRSLRQDSSTPPNIVPRGWSCQFPTSSTREVPSRNLPRNGAASCCCKCLPHMETA